MRRPHCDAALLAGRLSDLGQKFALIILHIHVQIMDRKCRIVRYNKVSLVWTCVRTCDAAFGSIRLACCVLFLAKLILTCMHILKMQALTVLMST